jgi:putative ABC transport system permease protein
MNWSFAFKNLFRNKRRSISTGIAICVGFVGLNLLGAYIFRSKKALDATSIYLQQRGHFSIFKHEAFAKYQIHPEVFALSLSEQNQIQQVLNRELNANIDYISRQLSTAGLLSNGTKSHPVLIYGFDPEAYKNSLQQPNLLRWAKDWVKPSQLENLNIFIDKPDTVSITAKIAAIMNLNFPLKNTDSVQLAAKNFDGDLNAIDATLGAEHTTGLQFLEDTVILLPLPRVQDLLSTQAIESMSIYLKNDVSTDLFFKKLQTSLKQLNFKTDVYRFDDPVINPMHQGTMGFLYVMGGFFIFLICTAVSLTIINSLTMGIIERTREIGTLRAVGFKVNQVIQLYIKENILLCLISMSVGVFLSYIISVFINAANIQFFPPGASQKIQFILNWNLYLAASVFILLITISLISSYFVIRSKLKAKLISLLNDSEAGS